MNFYTRLKFNHAISDLRIFESFIKTEPIQIINLEIKFRKHEAEETISNFFYFESIGTIIYLD